MVLITLKFNDNRSGGEDLAAFPAGKEIFLEITLFAKDLRIADLVERGTSADVVT